MPRRTASIAQPTVQTTGSNKLGLRTRETANDARRAIYAALMLIAAIVTIAPGIFACLVAVEVELDHSFSEETTFNAAMIYFIRNFSRFYIQTSNIATIITTPIPIFLTQSCYTSGASPRFNTLGIIVSIMLIFGLLSSLVGLNLYPSSAIESDPLLNSYATGLYSGTVEIVRTLRDCCASTFRLSFAFLLLVLHQKGKLT